MKKHLTLKDDKSDKFWAIEVNGKSFTVTYGKAGTAGQISMKEFDTDERCMKEAEKLVSEKLKKGYVAFGDMTSEKDFLKATQINPEGAGVRLMSKRMRYEMQDDDVVENYLFTIASNPELKVHYSRQGTSTGDLLFTGKAIESAKGHIVLSQGSHSSNEHELPDRIDLQLPPIILSRSVVKELKQTSKSKFKFAWGYDPDQVTKIKLKEKKYIILQIDGESIKVPILICDASNDDCEDIVLWVVDDDTWPIILIHDWDGDFFLKFLEAGNDLNPEDVPAPEKRFDFIHYNIPENFEREIITVFENKPNEKPECIKKWKSFLSNRVDLHINFSPKLNQYARKFHNYVQQGYFEGVSRQLDEVIFFFEELLGNETLKVDFEKLRSIQKFLYESILRNKLRLAFTSTDTSQITNGIHELPKLSDKSMMNECVTLIYSVFNSFLKSKRLSEAKELLQSYVEVLPLTGKTEALVKGNDGNTSNLDESFASDAVVLSVLLKDNEVFAMAEKLLSPVITNGKLAFNLACLYATKNEKVKMLNSIRQAIKLGKTKNEFLSDSDFTPFKEDPDFTNVLNEKN